MGDCAPFKQNKQNKLTPRFNDKPVIVVHRNKSRITAENSDKCKITCNVSHFKHIPKPSNLYSEADSEANDAESERETNDDDDDDHNDAKQTNVLCLDRMG